MLTLTPEGKARASTLALIGVNIINVALTTLNLNQRRLDSHLERILLESNELAPTLIETHGLVEVDGLSSTHLDIRMKLITVEQVDMIDLLCSFPNSDFLNSFHNYDLQLHYMSHYTGFSTRGQPCVMLLLHKIKFFINQ